MAQEESQRRESAENFANPPTNNSSFTPNRLLAPSDRESTSSPVEMTQLNHQHTVEGRASESTGPGLPQDVESPQYPPAVHQQPDAAPLAASSPDESNDPSISLSLKKTGSPKVVPPNILTREKTMPAIEPSIDKSAPSPKELDPVSPSLLITLLLISGARHPFRIDERYLNKRNVRVDSNNPVNMSVYTLKELIWREWRDEWETRPSSPSSIRIIFYGKLLDDKARLQDCRFETGSTPHVVHMTIKPQEVVDEEDAKMAKSGGRDRDSNEGSTGCRCVIL